MNKQRKLIIAGNWKMNKTVAESLALVRGLKIELANIKEVDIVICPPFTALSEVSKAILDSNLRLGAQNMSEHNVGAYTGEIAAVMLKEFSVRYVICLLYTSDAADERSSVDLGGRRIIKKKKKK